MAIDPRQQEQVSRIAAQQLGAAPEPAPAPAPAPKDAPTTAQEEANEVASPQTEGDRQAEDAVMYKIKFGEEERNLSPQQIAGTYDRYRDLNHKQALMKPVNALAERLMETTKGNPEQIAKLLAASVDAYTKNPQMGRQREPTAGVAQGGDQTGTPSDYAAKMNDEWQKYEDDNAISLPPGFRESMERMSRMEAQMGQQMQMMQGVMNNASAAAQSGSNSRDAAIASRDQVIAQTISNNLDRAQQEAGLPDDAASDFAAFIGERGFDRNDFSDYDLTRRVVDDFKRMKDTPQFEQLKNTAARREAYLTAQSGGPTSSMAASGGDDTLARLASRAMNRG